jgi:DNA-binding Lrp family transcriptional regulator
MVVGVCLINVELGEESRVKETLTRQEGIRELLHLFGEYDFIAIIDIEGLQALNVIVDKIRDVKGITATRTIIGAEF